MKNVYCDLTIVISFYVKNLRDGISYYNHINLTGKNTLPFTEIMEEDIEQKRISSRYIKTQRHTIQVPVILITRLIEDLV